MTPPQTPQIPKVLAPHEPLQREGYAQRSPDTVSVISYNILLPNQEVGWWIYKYYDPQTPRLDTEWEHRQSLLKRDLLRAQTDLICIQEAEATRFEEHFEFLSQAGYESALHKKSRFRCATFWHRERFELVSVRHQYRALITVLRARSSLTSASALLYVINCHLSGGPQPQERLRQLHDALRRVNKEAVALGQDPATAAIIICGDFNSSTPDSGADRLLNRGEVLPEDRDPSYPEQVLTQKTRVNPWGVFHDVYLSAQPHLNTPLASLIIAQVKSHLIDPQSKESTELFKSAIQNIFDQFASDDQRSGKRFDEVAIDRWITHVNRLPHRGSEYHKAMERLTSSEGSLSVHDLEAIYRSELEEGKGWSVYHDLALCNPQLPPLEGPPIKAYIDRIYTQPAVLRPLVVRALLSDEDWVKVEHQGESLPNSWHPSDHLPLAALFEWR